MAQSGIKPKKEKQTQSFRKLILCILLQTCKNKRRQNSQYTVHMFEKVYTYLILLISTTSLITKVVSHHLSYGLTCSSVYIFIFNHFLKAISSLHT